MIQCSGELLEHSFNIVMLACFVENLNFSMETDQVLLIVRFSKGGKLISELLAILNTSEFMDVSDLRLELGSGS